jgi:DNA-binding HxlR family transcriptional regulator
LGAGQTTQAPDRLSDPAILPRPKEGTAIPPSPPPKRHPYDQWSPDARALDLVGDKWTLLIIRDLAGGPRRFVELQRTLPGISTEQLRSRLNRMVADDLLTRQRYREVPPRVDYELTQRARALLPVVTELARWGRRFAWSPPRERERIDIGAILRAATGATPPAGVRGGVTFKYEQPDRGVRTATLYAAAGHLSYSEGPPQEHGASVSGDLSAYIAALGPGGARDALTIEGDAKLAHAVLDVLGEEAEDEGGDATSKAA